VLSWCQARSQVALAVEIYNKNAETEPSKEYGEVERNGRFANTALLVGDGNDFGQVLFGSSCSSVWCGSGHGLLLYKTYATLTALQGFSSACLRIAK
jgi:hypothetical protein